MIQAVMTANNLSYVTVLDFIKLMNLTLGEKKLPESIYLFKKVCCESISYEKNFFCTGCMKGYGRNEPIGKVCTDCRKTTIDYFISNSIEDNLIKIVTKNSESISKYKEDLLQLDGDVISDINNGEWHRSLEDRDSTITVNLNTDGVAPFNSSKKSSLWPILLTVNDLPPSLRYQKRNVLAAGYWFSDVQPDMSLFLEPFITEINRLSLHGIHMNNRQYKIKVCCCCLDSVARAKVLKIKMFNGYYGCTFCLHPVVNQRFPYMQSEERCLTSLLQDITDWENLSDVQKRNGESCNGVKGRTELLSIEGFDPTIQMPVDFMHCVLLGVMKHLLTLWLKPSYSSRRFHISKDRQSLMEDRYKKIKTYTECTRKASSLVNKYQVFKANEYFNFLFYYSKYVLCAPVLEPEYFQHFILLVHSIEILYGSSFKMSDLDRCRDNLDLFLQQFETLYDVQFMVYNVHLLSHITKTARLFGPLSTTSLFIFENTNGVLNRFLSGPKGPTLQICIRHYLYFTNFYSNERRLCNSAKLFCLATINKDSNKYKYSNEHRIRKNYTLPDNIENPYNTNRQFESYNKYYYKNVIISTIEQSNRNKLYCDCYIVCDDSFYEISKILKEKNSNGNFFYILGRQLSVRSYPMLQNYFEIVNYSPVRLIRIDAAITKCIHFDLSGRSCLVMIKNTLLVD
jgi:hypothetical protein